MQLPFAVIPLMMFASDKARMGAFGAPRWQVVTGWVIAAVIVALNVKVLLNVAFGA
jgi:manganese transport protein